MHKNIDGHKKKFKKQIDDIEVMLKEGKHCEVIYEKQRLKDLKKNMSTTIEKYKEPEENVHRFAKKEILANLYNLLSQFLEVMNFTIEELEVEEMEMASKKNSQE